jgi:hypothetical protein
LRAGEEEESTIGRTDHHEWAKLGERKQTMATKVRVLIEFCAE